LAENQAKKELREVLTEQIQEHAIDTEIGRIVAAASKKKAAKAPKSRADISEELIEAARQVLGKDASREDCERYIQEQREIDKSR
jgi:hypothetical protein